MIFRYNESAGISSLDPAFTGNLENLWAANMLFNGLVAINDSLQVVPAIAKSWEVDSTGLQYTFHLRDDVYFHDDDVFENGEGRRVVAGDFVYSFHRLRDPGLASPGVWVFGSVAEHDPFEAVDDTTLIVRLRRPFPPFLGLLGMKYCSVVPKEAVEYYGHDFRNNPVGTGPFQFNFWIENTRLALLKNPNYFERDEEGNRLPYLDAVSVSFVPDKSAAYLDFLKGNFDFMSGLHSSYNDELLTPEGELNELYSERIHLNRTPFLKTDYLGFVTQDLWDTDSPWFDKDLRRAVNYGIDRVSMVRYLRNNVYTPALGGFIPVGMPGYNPGVGYEYNPDSVRVILRRKGYPGGEGLPALKLSTTADYVDLCEYVQHQLGEFGIRISVDVLPASVHREQSNHGKLPFFRKSWLTDYPDDENFMALFYSPNQSPAGPNYTQFSNELFDQMYREALREHDPKKRVEMYAQMDSLMMTYAPVVPLYYDVVMRFVSNRVSGLDSNPMNILDLRRVKIAGENK